jgi:ketosteroid isomerase-like protein
MNDAKSWTLTAAVSAALLLGARPGTAAVPDAREAIEKAGAAFSVLLAKGDAAGLAAMYAADAQVFPPNGDIVTGTAIQKVWQGVIDAGIKGAKFTIVEVNAGGDLAVESGRYEITGADGAVVDNGKYVVVWKQTGGRWKILRDIWNTSVPAPAK